MPEVTIEETADAGLIHRLTQAAFAEYGFEPGTSTALKETAEAVAAQFNEGSRALVATIAEEPVACVRYRIEGYALYFFRLSVDPAHRRKGLATALMQRLEALAIVQGLSRLTCSVRLEKTDNVALYTGLGFQLMGTRSVCRDGTPVPTGDFELPLPPAPSPGRSYLAERGGDQKGPGNGDAFAGSPSLKELATGRGRGLGGEVTPDEVIRPKKIIKGRHVFEGKRILAKEFRTNPTPTEAILWEKLRNGRLNGLKFRRQQIIEGFIADFYCHAAALVVELDGSVHDEPERDAARDAIFFGQGILVIRFPNNAVENHLEGVLSQIAQVAKERLPLSQGGTTGRERGQGGEV